MPESLGPRSYLVYRGFRYLWWSLLLLGTSIAAYVLDRPVEGRSGGSWLGYTLGSVAAGIVLWLAWLGVRKRSYRARGSELKGWVSAHVYLGLSLVILVPLHSAFQFGWNIHTLAYALMSLVVLSGVLGVVSYASLPGRISRGRAGRRFKSFLTEIAHLDVELSRLAQTLPTPFDAAARRSLEETQIGGSFWRQLRGNRVPCATASARDVVRSFLPQIRDGREESAAKELELALYRKQLLLSVVRRDIQLRALLDVWLWFHVPLTLATLAAIAAHVFVVLYYR